MAAGRDPYTVLGVRPGADQAEIHAAYRAAVRRTHPDAGGTAAAFEAVQEAYETLREAPGRRTGAAAGGSRPRPRPSPKPGPGPGPGPSSRGQTSRPGADGGSFESSRMEAILAESRRLEDEARRLAGLPPRHETAGSAGAGAETADSVAAILRDAREQVREAAGPVARELRKRLRRLL